MNLDFDGKDASCLKSKKLWLFDMDGTIYEDECLFDGTLDLFRKIRKDGNIYMLLTNNSSRSVEDYVRKVTRMNIPATRDDFFTSVQATVLYLKNNHPGERVYAQGTRSFIEELVKSGINVTEEYDETATVILVGFDTELTFEKMRRTTKMLTGFKGAYIAANLDYVCPTDYGFVPDCGSMCIGYKYATGLSPIVIGKPEPTMIDIACQKTGIAKEDAVIIGDRLYTDIASGVNAGITTICVLSGEAKLDEIHAYEKQPTYIFESVKEIYELLENA